MTIKNNQTLKLYTLLSTQVVSLIGSRMTAFALGIWLYQMTGKTMDLLLIPFFNEMPSLLFGHLLGVAVDRYHRKWLIILADLGQAVGSLLLVLSILSGHFELWHLYGIVVLQGLFAALQTPAIDAVLVNYTTDSNRSKMNAVKELGFPLAGGLSPALGGLLFVSFGISGVILVDLLSFVLGSIVILMIKIPRQSVQVDSEQPHARWSSEAKAGFAYLKSEGRLLWLILYVACVNFMLNGPLELLLPYLLEVTGNQLITSALMTVMSLATAICALYFSVMRLPQKRISLLIAALCLTGLALVSIGIVRSPFWLLLLISLAMAPLPIINIVFKTILQDSVPEQFQGRVFSMAYQVGYGIAPLSFLLIGPLVDHFMEPMMQQQRVGWLSSIFGSSAGSGMGLTLSLTGFAIIAISLLFYQNKQLARLDKRT